MSISFKCLTLRNFMSYGNNVTTVNLDQPGTTLIVGEDLDNPSSGESNGVGKTTIMNAFTYALYDKPISDDISKDDLVNNINKKNMEVTLEFTCDGKEYKIVRTRKTKSGNAGNNVYLYENDVDKTPDSMAATNEKIENIIGMPYEVFVRIVVFSATHTPFLNLTTKEQTAIIEELFGLTSISRKAELLKAFIKDAEQSLKLKQTKVESVKQEHERHNLQVESAKKRIESWSVQQVQNIQKVKEQIEDLHSIDVSAQQSLFDKLVELQELVKTKQLELTKETAELHTQQRLIQSKEKERKTAFSLATTTEGNIKKYEQEHEHLKNATCPYCMQHFADAADKIVACTDKIAQSKADLNDIGEEINSIAEDIELDSLELQRIQFGITQIENEISSVNQQIAVVRKEIVVSSSKELQQIENEKSNLQRKIGELEAETNPYNEVLDELLLIKLDDIDYTEINDMSKLIDHQKFLLKLLTKKDSFVRKTLLNKNIPFLNTKLQEYLSELGLPHKVEFTKEMAASISRFGHPLGFGNLSAGQRARVNFALSLAFKDVLQSIHTKVNVFMLDEILDVGLDSAGVRSAARLVKRKARDEKLSMFVISHKEEINNIFERRMVVQLHNGFSHIKESE